MPLLPGTPQVYTTPTHAGSECKSVQNLPPDSANRSELKSSEVK